MVCCHSSKGITATGDVKQGKLDRITQFSNFTDGSIVLQSCPVLSEFYCVALCISDDSCMSCLYLSGVCTTFSWYLPLNTSSQRDGDVYFYYGRPVIDNIALGKPVTQSSTYGTMVADHALDGNVYTQSHTADWDKAPWMQIDLEQVYKIIKFRFRGKLNHSVNRLHDIAFMVSYTTTFDLSCGYYVGPPQIGEWVELHCVPYTEGRYVKLDKQYSASTWHLELFELEITVTY